MPDILTVAREALAGSCFCGEPDCSYKRLAQAVIDLSVALTALVNKLDTVHASPQYRSVWACHQIHFGSYAGPQYVEELDNARAVLGGKDLGGLVKR